MNKKAFTLVEIIIVIVIAAILGSGTYVFMQKMLERAIKAEFITQKSLQTQAAIDQLAYMLKGRIVNSTINYNNDGTSYEVLDLSADTRPVLEWIGEEIDLKYAGSYSGFIDLDASTQNHIIARDFNLSAITATDYAVVFAGNDDLGEGSFSEYGWHGSDDNVTYPINAASDIGGNDANLTLQNASDETVKIHYEKYYLVKSGYAVTRGEELDKNTFDNDCNLSVQNEDFNNTLFLFYDFQPWEGETFCADDSGNKQGKVTVLLDEVTGFEASYDGTVMRLKLEVTNPHEVDDTTLSKTKAVF